MLPRKPRHLLYAIFLVLLSLIFSSAIARSMVRHIVADISTAINSINSAVVLKNSTEGGSTSVESTLYHPEEMETEVLAPSMMFATIINGANQVVECSNDGSTLAKFFLCGTGDDRTITVNGSGTITWEKQIASCTLIGTDACPVKETSCYGSAVTGSTYFLDASDPNVAGEYR